MQLLSRINEKTRGLQEETHKHRHAHACAIQKIVTVEWGSKWMRINEYIKKYAYFYYDPIETKDCRSRRSDEERVKNQMQKENKTVK